MEKPSGAVAREDVVKALHGAFHGAGSAHEAGLVVQGQDKGVDLEADLPRIGRGQQMALLAGLGHGGRDFSAVLQLLRGRLADLETTA